MPILLKVVKGKGEGQILTVPDGQTITLGRGTDATYMLADPLLSREHCALRCNPEGCKVVDLKSLNGTFLNGKRLAEPRPIVVGDRVRLGSIVIEVFKADPPSPVLVEEPVAPGGTMVLDRPPVFAPPPVAPPATTTPPADDASEPGRTVVIDRPPQFPVPPPHAPAMPSTLVLDRAPLFAPLPATPGAPPRVETTPLPEVRTCEACGAPLPPAEERTMCPSCFDRFDVKEDMLEGFRIVERILRTPTGNVFKAEQPLLGRTVLVKILTTTGWEQDERTLRRFMREAKAAARLSHPSIVEFFDVNEQGEHVFIVMEYVDGPTLDELVQKKGPVPARTALRYMAQIADALAFVHSNKLVHRDVRPGTIMVSTADDRAKLADFTLARNVEIASFGEITATADTLAGVPYFESPEQVRDSRKVDARSDLYSYGATFFYVLTGRRPIGGNNYIEFLSRLANESAPALASVLPALPPELCAVVDRALAREPENRFQSMDEVSAALAPLLAALGIDA